MRKINIDYEELKELYVNKKLTLKECGYKLRCSDRTAHRRLREYNIPVRTNSESHINIKYPNRKRPPLFTKEHRRKMSESRKGEGNSMYGRRGGNCPNWQGGISFEPYSPEFNRQLKELIRNRDNYQCQICGMPECENIYKLHIHHIDYNKKNLNPINLISLCTSCHTKTNYKREYWEAYFRRVLI